MGGFEERGMVIFSLSFTAGITAVFLFQGIFYNPLIASIFFSITCILSAFSFRKDAYNKIGKLLVFILPLLCGLVCGLSVINIPYENSNILIDLTAPLSELVKSAINDIPFVNKENNELIMALITGDRSNLSPQVYASFRDSGAAHILALSGFHLGIIYLILEKMLWPLGNSPKAKKNKSILLILLTGIYSFSTGAAPSIIRAFIFIFIREIARLLEREISLKQIFYAALTIQLIFSPSSIKSLGFQLSYLAVAGIVYIYPYLRNCYPDELEDKSWMKSVWNTAAMSIACQIATTPLIWIVFKTFPKYFLLTNNIAIPLTSLIMPYSIIVILLNWLGLCPEIALKGLEFLLNTLVFSLETISTM